MLATRSRWWIVFASGLGLVVGQGPILVFATGVFLKPVSEDLGFGRGEISTAIGISNVMTAISAPFFGRALDLWGVRRPVAGLNRAVRAGHRGDGDAGTVIHGACPALWGCRPRQRRAEPDSLLESHRELLRSQPRARDGTGARRCRSGDDTDADTVQYADHRVRLAHRLCGPRGRHHAGRLPSGAPPPAGAAGHEHRQKRWRCPV